MKPITEHPKFTEATQEIDKLSNALTKVVGRIAEIEAILSTPVDSKAQPEDSRVTAALEYAETGVVRGPGNVPTELKEEHLVLREQRDALKRTLDERYQTREQLAQELSGEVCADLRTKHKAIAKRSLAVLLELNALQEEELQMQLEIQKAGFSVRFQQTAALWPQVGMLSQISGSLLWYRVRELKDYAS